LRATFRTWGGGLGIEEKTAKKKSSFPQNTNQKKKSLRERGTGKGLGGDRKGELHKLIDRLGQLDSNLKKNGIERKLLWGKRSTLEGGNTPNRNALKILKGKEKQTRISGRIGLKKKEVGGGREFRQKKRGKKLLERTLETCAMSH